MSIEHELRNIWSIQFIYIHVCTYKYLYCCYCGLAPGGSWDPPCCPSFSFWAGWSGLSLGLVGVSSGCAPSSFSCTPRLCPGAMRGEAEKILKLCKCCLVITYYHKHCFVHKSKHSTAGAAMKKMNSIQTKTHYMCCACVCNSDGNPQREILAFQNTWNSETHVLNIPVFSLCM